MLWDPSKDKPVEPILDEVGKTMHLAADYLETHRWGQGDYALANGAVCLMGALIKVERGEVHSCETANEDQEALCPIAKIAYKRVERYINRNNQSGYRDGVYNWNDDDKRKKSEVIAVLREAAK